MYIYEFPQRAAPLGSPFFWVVNSETRSRTSRRHRDSRRAEGGGATYSAASWSGKVAATIEKILKYWVFIITVSFRENLLWKMKAIRGFAHRVSGFHYLRPKKTGCLEEQPAGERAERVLAIFSVKKSGPHPKIWPAWQKQVAAVSAPSYRYSSPVVALRIL